jgi:hypothetical protein
MHVSIDPGDRKLLIVSGALLVGLGLAGFLLSPAGTSPSAGFPSTYATDAGGGKAAYLLLGEMGYQAERWTAPPDRLPADPSGAVLVLAGPTVQPSAGEKSQVRAFINAGGRVVVTGISGGAFLPEYHVVPTAKPVFEFQKFTAEVPGPLTRHAPEILMETNFRWGAPLPDQERVYGDADGAVVVTYRLGKGSVVWWADSSPLSNFGLKQASNLMLFLNSVDASRGQPGCTRVLWDEYFHGQRIGFWSYVGRTPAPWALLQLGLLAAAAIFTFARRSGPLRPLVEESRLSPLEFIDTLGALYQRKGAAREALEIAYHRFRFALLGRLGLPLTASPDEIARGVRERLGWTVPGFWETLQRSERGVKSTGIDDVQAMHLVRELYDYGRRFRLQQGVGSRQ